MSWAGLSIFYLLPCAHPTCPNHLELPPGRMGWSWNRQKHRAPVGGLPPSPEQRDKAAPLGKGVKPPRRDWLLSIAYVRLQSLQRPVRRPCMQWPVPQSLQRPFRRPCTQWPVPQSLHWLLRRPCKQWPVPQSLHWLLGRPCMQWPEGGGETIRLPRRGQYGRAAAGFARAAAALSC
jgi:hypothetical protein